MSKQEIALIVAAALGISAFIGMLSYAQTTARLRQEVRCLKSGGEALLIGSEVACLRKGTLL